jgi:hypothetical protein
MKMRLSAQFWTPRDAKQIAIYPRSVKFSGNGIGLDPDHDNNLKRSRNRERRRLDCIIEAFLLPEMP